MIYFKKIMVLLMAFSMTAALFAGCAGSASDQAVESTAQTTVNIEIPAEDDTWSDEDSTHITLNGDSAQIDGNGAEASDGSVTISKAGTYVVAGTLDDGQLIVNASSDDSIHLVLNGAAINCSDSAPVYVLQADKVVLTLAPDTKNTLTDGETYDFSGDEDEPNAALFSKNDLSINGSGTLTISSSYNHGIFSKDDLTITNGDIMVSSVADAIKGKDSVSISGGSFTLTAGEMAFNRAMTRIPKRVIF